MNIRVAEISEPILKAIKNALKTLEGENVTQLLKELETFASDEGASLLLTKEGSPLVKDDSVIKVRDLVIDPRRHEVSRCGEKIDLTAKEFEILHFLASNRGEVFTKEQIYNAVWDGKYYLDDSNIMSFIRKLRKKLEPDPDDPIYILTIWGVGYKFID